MPSLKVLTIAGRTIHVEIDGDDTIKNIKYKVADKLGVDPHMQRLICNNIELNDDEQVVNMMELLDKWDGTLHLMLKGSIREKYDFNTPPDVGPEEKPKMRKKGKGRFKCNII